VTTKAIITLPKNYKPGETTGVVLAPGASGGIESKGMEMKSQLLADAGFLVIRVDHIVKSRVPPNVAAYRAAVQELSPTGSHPCKDVVLAGHSMGNRVACEYANSVDSKIEGLPILGLLFFSYPLHPPGQPDNLRDAPLYELKLPTFFVSGTKDPFFTRKLYDKVTSKMPGEVSSMFIEGGDHSLHVAKKVDPRGDKAIMQDIIGLFTNWVTDRHKPS